MSEISQATIVGLSQPKTWHELERGCLATFGGGHRGAEYEAFQHGMSTVFSLLRAEFPPAEVCKAAPDLLDVLIESLPYIEMAEHDEAYKCGAVRAVVNRIRAAISKAEGTDQ